MPAQLLEIHVIADSTGETAARLARAAQAQFPDHPMEIIRHPRITTAEGLFAALEQLRRQDTRPVAVLSTLVNQVLRDIVDDACAELGITHCDLIGPTLSQLEVATGSPAVREPMRPVGVEADYFTRMAAMEFAVRHDDGQQLSGLAEADIVLIGVSRSGKTPLSMYLGYLGYRTANVPLVPNISPPTELLGVDSWRIVGLTIDPQRLATFRGQRARGLGIAKSRDGYADLASIYEEVETISAMQKRLGARIIDTTNVALEESAARVIDIVEMRARMAGTHLRRESAQRIIVTPDEKDQRRT